MVVTTWHDLIGGREVIRGPVALTIGTFDGVHRGHREIVRRLTERAAGTGRGAPAAPRARAPHRAVLTFRQHPRAVLAHRHPGPLTTLRQRRERFAALGVTHLVLIDFSVPFSRLSGGEFISALRRAMLLRKLVVGVGFRCGRGRGTDVVELRRLLAPAGVPVVAVPPVMVGDHVVSSTRIRAAVRAGDFAVTREMMGSPFEVDLRGAAEIRGAEVHGHDAVSEWSARGAVADRWYVAAEQLEQILPQPGTYAASLAVAGGDQVAVVVEVAPDGLRWAWPAARRCVPLVLRFHRRVDPAGDVTIASRIQEK